MILKNKVFNALLSAEERQQLKDVIIYEKQNRLMGVVIHGDDGVIVDPEEYNVIRIDGDRGRLLIESINIPENIISKLTKVVKDEYADCEYVGATYCEYDKKYGNNPILEMHFDREGNNACLDYQFESNTQWALVIDKNEYELVDNQSVIFQPSVQFHGRKPKEFENEEFLNMFFFWFEMPAND
jgi:hypothetical protein